MRPGSRRPRTPASAEQLERCFGDATVNQPAAENPSLNEPGSHVRMEGGVLASPESTVEKPLLNEPANHRRQSPPRSLALPVGR